MMKIIFLLHPTQSIRALFLRSSLLLISAFLVSCNSNLYPENENIAATPPATSIPQTPAAPSTSDVGSSSVTINWLAVSDATFYKLSRGNVVISSALTTLSYRDTALSPNTLYSYVVQACNTTGCSNASVSATATTTAPIAFSEIKSLVDSNCTSCHSTVGRQSPDLTTPPTSNVTNNADRSNFRIQNGSMPPAGGLTAAQKQLFADWVVQGKSDSTTPLAVVTPSAPTTPSTSVVSSTSLNVSWTAVSGASFYKVLRDGVTINSNVSALTFADTALNPSTSYAYTVQACNSAGCSVSSTSASATTAAVVPSTPSTPTTSNVSSSSVTVSWTAVNGATFYKVLRNGSIINSNVSALTLSDSSLIPSNLYVYTVQACNTAGCSAASAAVAATTASVPPNAPSTPSTSGISSSSITVNWTAVSGASFYKVLRNGSEINNNVTGLTFSDTGLSPNTNYVYTVQACNVAGCSAASSSVLATTAGVPPSAPSTPSTNGISASSITVNWTAVSGASFYKVLRNGTEVIGNVTALVLSDSGLTSSTSYTYAVQACNAAGCSASSPSVSATTAGVPPNAPSTPTTSNVSSSSVTVSWTAVSGATFYKVLRGGVAINSNVSALTFADSGLTASTSYTYTVQACNAAGCSASSASTSVTTTAALVGFSQIQSLVNNNCTSCHSAAGLGQSPFLNTLPATNLTNNADRSNIRIQAGTMPPSGGLTAAQKQLFADWISQGKSTTN